MISLKALVVEDDPSLQLMYQLKLESAGFITKTAADGVQGLHAAESFMPAVILLDLRMPNMDGAEMLQALRAEDWGQDIRVIILTNISRDEAPQVLRFLNVDRYIVKAHHTPQQVLEIVTEVLAK